MHARRSPHCHRRFIGTAGGAVITMTVALSAYGGVTLDGTLGPAGALPGPDYQIGADLGRQVGGNLFHSFGQFFINTGESATFSGPNSVSNIIGRVTGGEVSSIDGMLRSTIPGANLYLLNPAGVLFGEHAQLDVPGSVHVSTADYLRLSDGGRFDARTPANSVLTVAPVAAFGFLGGTPGRITVEGALLKVPEGQTLSLIGGDLTLTDATLYAPAGRINLASVASAGEVLSTETDLAMQGFGVLGTLTMVRDPSVERVTVNLGGELGVVPLADIDISGVGGGTIFIRGGQWVSEGGWMLADTYGAQAGGDINLNVADNLILQNNSIIATDTHGAGNAGSITLTARNLLVDSSDITSKGGFAGRYGATGGGGDINLNVADTLTLQNFSDISTSPSVNGAGNAGSITLTADTISVLSRTFISTQAAFTGDGGTITLTARNLLIDESAILSNSTVIATGGGGDINLNVADNLILRNGGFINANTQSSGNAGSITVTAGNLVIDGQVGSINWETGIISGVGSGFLEAPTGAGGKVNITATDTISILNGGVITAETNGAGNAGSVTINAGRSINITGGIERKDAFEHPYFQPSGVFVSASYTGQAGNLTLTTPALTISDGGGISAQSLNTTGGNLFINADHLKMFNGSEISSSVQGNEFSDGGNITLNSTNIVALNGSTVTARATEGLGGNILVNAEVFLHDAASVDEVLNASSQVAGNDGTVQNNAPTTDISGSLTALPARYLNAADQLSHRCGMGDRDARSSFTVQGRGALPLGPDEPAAVRTSGCRFEQPTPARATPPTSVITATPATAMLGFGDR